MPDIALLCALETELKPILRELRLRPDPHTESDYVGRVAGVDVVAAIFGIGAERAQRAIAYMADKQPKMIILAGFAGGLDPFFRTGYLFTAQQVVNEEGYAVELIGDVPRVIERSPSHATLLSTWDPVLNSYEKASMFEQHHAGAVDMETFAAAWYAAEHNVPLTVVRAISDAADASIPPWAMGLIGEDGLMNISRAAATAIGKPWRLGAMLEMQRNAKAASRALAVSVAGRIATWAQEQEQ